MPKVNITPKKLVKILQKNNFVFIRQNGSHAIFRNFQKNKKVVVPIHSKDIPTGTAHAILKDADIQL
jgi:mRNA interferase HicA